MRIAKPPRARMLFTIPEVETQTFAEVALRHSVVGEIGTEIRFNN